MSYLHSHNIIHCDLKPGNILIDNFLFPKVADFGLSKCSTLNKDSIYRKTAAGVIKGTPIYTSPEIWRKSEYSHNIIHCVIKGTPIYTSAEYKLCKKWYGATEIMASVNFNKKSLIKYLKPFSQ